MHAAHRAADLLGDGLHRVARLPQREDLVGLLAVDFRIAVAHRASVWNYHGLEAMSSAVSGGGGFGAAGQLGACGLELYERVEGDLAVFEPLEESGTRCADDSIQRCAAAHRK